jgi:hypothetical protein
MHGALVEGLQINPGVMDLIRLQVLHQQFLLLKNQKQERCACVNKQRILHSVMDLIWAWGIDPNKFISNWLNKQAYHKYKVKRIVLWNPLEQKNKIHEN